MVLSRVGQPLLLPGRGSWLVRAAGPRVVQAALRGEAVRAVRSAPRQPFSRLASVLRSPHAAALIAVARTLWLRSAACVVLPVQEKCRTRWGCQLVRGLAYEHTRLLRLRGVAAKRVAAVHSASHTCWEAKHILQEANSAAALQALQPQRLVIHQRANNPPGRATPWRQDSSASASWAKAWPAAS